MTDEQEIIKQLAQAGLMINPEGMEEFLKKESSIQELIKLATENNVWYIDKGFIDEYLGPPTTPGVVEKSNHKHAKEIENKLEINYDSDVSTKSTCGGLMDDFIDFFNQRYHQLRNCIMERVDYRTATTIENLKSNQNNSTIIAMVIEKRQTNAGHLLLEVEDPSGDLTVFLNSKDDDMKKIYERLLEDEVIGIKGSLRNTLFIAKEITQPDIPLNRKKNYADEEVYAAFLSDIHVGSYLFMEKEFQKFLDWINGNGDHKRESSMLKYVLVAGDLVDGIGIYPRQDRELTIPDIYKQYDFLSMLIEQIPDHIQVVLGVGNHDAVRIAEPQPRIGKDLCPKLHELDNVHLVGNPVNLNMHGVETIMYHGNTLDDVIRNIADCNYREPDKPMIEYLKRRTLAPSYGVTGVVPESKDYMHINRVPDILHCGHVHTNGYSKYRGVHVINSGTWQGKTQYQEQLGHQPTPARVPIMNLQTHELKILDFNSK